MALYDMKELPHLVKPASLILIILQIIFVFAPGYRGFGWFVIMTTIIQLIVGVLVLLGMLVDIGLVRTSMWAVAEIGYSAAFTLFQAINFFFFLVNVFGHFNFWLLLGVFTSALLCLVWLFNAFQWWRARTPPPPSQPTTTPPPPKFTPSYPAGVNPA
ncbi:unnamed protein product [Cylicocyclus nassatus]|uniref:MARVEL domain-containing protein n=1 Tax=Cylicocyclus nassatus TaxID=53992 RepID=A0AA36MD62_CYLNA|nr:unnamed protein product [Cylicocyclus nassatus]